MTAESTRRLSCKPSFKCHTRLWCGCLGNILVNYARCHGSRCEKKVYSIITSIMCGVKSRFVSLHHVCRSSPSWGWLRGRCSQCWTACLVSFPGCTSWSLARISSRSRPRHGDRRRCVVEDGVTSHAVCCHAPSLECLLLENISAGEDQVSIFLGDRNVFKLSPQTF